MVSDKEKYRLDTIYYNIISLLLLSFIATHCVPRHTHNYNTIDISVTMTHFSLLTHQFDKAAAATVWLAIPCGDRRPITAR